MNITKKYMLHKLLYGLLIGGFLGVGTTNGMEQSSVNALQTFYGIPHEIKKIIAHMLIELSLLKYEHTPGYTVTSRTEVTGKPELVVLSPTGRFCFVNCCINPRCSQKSYISYVIDIKTQEVLVQIEEANRAIKDALFTAYENQLLTVNFCGEAQVWDRKTGKKLSDKLCNGKKADKVAFSPDGMYILIVTNTVLTKVFSEARLWHVEKGLITSLERNSMVDVATFSPDGQSLLIGDRDGIVAVVDSGTGKLLQEIDTKLKNDWGGPLFLSLAVSSDGQKLLIGTYSTIILLNLTTGDQLKKFSASTCSTHSKDLSVISSKNTYYFESIIFDYNGEIVALLDAGFWWRSNRENRIGILPDFKKGLDASTLSFPCESRFFLSILPVILTASPKKNKAEIVLCEPAALQELVTKLFSKVLLLLSWGK